MKKAMILAVVASAAMLSACHTSGKVDNFAINVDAVSSATTAVDVPYKVANGYFVRNDVKKLPNGKISKQKDFEASFGMAAVMGNDGRRRRLTSIINMSLRCRNQSPTVLLSLNQ